MRILFCNKYNWRFSGTESYLFEVMDLLRDRGHEVALFSMADERGEPTEYDRYFVPHVDFKNQKGLWAKTRAAAQAVYSREARRRIRGMIREFQPDIAHVRNIYHHLSPSILWELKAQGVPVMYHLNDFKLLCPSYNLVAQGEACEACKGGRFRKAMAVKCYPGRGERLALVAEAYVHKWLGTYRKCVDKFLAPSEFVRDKFVEHGWAAAKFEVLPHFQKPGCAGAAPCATVTNDAQVLYFGRLSKEKGVDDLVRAIAKVPHMNLVVAGDGPERIELQQLARGLELKNVDFAGHVRGQELNSLIARSRFTVLPSHAYETLGKTILESYAEGRAVVASDAGSRRELIHQGETGLLYPMGDVGKLAETIEWLGSRPEVAERMGRVGRKLVEEKYTPEAHYQSLLSLYERTVEAARTGRKDRAAVGDEVLARPTQAGSKPRPIPGTNRRLKIAFIGGRGVVSKYSGIEAYYEEVGRRLVEMGHEVTVYCRNYFTPPMRDYEGMKIVRLPTFRTKHLDTLVHTLLSTLHVMMRRCDVVHYHTLGPALFSFFPRLAGKKTMVTVQGIDWQRKKWGKFASAVLRVGEHASVHLPDGTTVVSESLQQRYRERHRIEAFYVPNGGLMRERRPPNRIRDWGLAAGRYVLFLGRFSPEKGCHWLVEAFERIQSQVGKDVKLVLAGASSYCDEYSQKLRTHESDRIKFLDWVSGETLDELLTNCMLFVLPSDMEGLSLALLDAMGAGLCVLASDVPENREVVDDAGFTFKCGDAGDLAEKLAMLIANPSLREACGRAAKARIREKYQWSRIAEDIEKAYLRVLGVQVPRTGLKKPSARAISAGSNGVQGGQRRAG